MSCLPLLSLGLLAAAASPAASGAAASAPPPAANAATVTPHIDYEQSKLANGLTLLLHRDDAVPTVHVELWYRVGSKDEVPGKTGFAHLFEHIMFQGSKQIPEDTYFKYLKEAGASNINGSTWFDRTNYYETVPANRLELALWLESSRMGFLLQRPSFKETLDNQRDVVKNERRQRVENAPMGAVSQVQLEALYPKGHPYEHEVIGSMDDLTAASESDIRRFFSTYYAPNNALLVIAGDIDIDATKALVEKYFGPIPSGPPIERALVAPVTLAAPKRIAMEAKVNLPAEFVTWHSPAVFAPGDAELSLLARILAGGKASRLYQRLVYDMKIAQAVSADQQGMLLGGQFELSFTPLPGHTLAEVEAVVDQEMERVRTQPVEPSELERVKNQVKAEMIRRLEPIDARAAQLLYYTYYTGDPGFVSKDFERLRAVDAAAIQRVANQFLRKEARLVVTVEANPAAPIMGRLKGGRP